MYPVPVHQRRRRVMPRCAGGRVRSRLTSPAARADRPDARDASSARGSSSTSTRCRWPTSSLDRRRRAHRRAGPNGRRGRRIPLCASSYPRARGGAGWPAPRRRSATWPSIGGNLMQRTRCPYFRDVRLRLQQARAGHRLRGHRRPQPQPRHPRARATHCIAMHPSDLAVALTALDAAVITREGRRRASRSRSRTSTACRATRPTETTLEHGELITAIEVPVVPEARRSGYLQGARPRIIRVRAGVSAAVALDIADGQRARGPRRSRRRRDGAVAVARGRTSSGRPDRGSRPVARCRVTCRGRR